MQTKIQSLEIPLNVPAGPRVSVVMLTCHRPHLLKRAIQSVVDQQFQNWELIVIHDGPDEQTAALMNDWTRRDPRMTYLPRGSIGNIGDGINFGLRHARGEYIAILDDDDYWADPQKLANQIAFLDTHPAYVACGGGMILVDEQARELRRFLKPESDQSLRSRALIANPIVHSTAMYRRSAADQVGGYDAAALSQFQDWDFWLKMALVGKLYNLPSYLTYYAVLDSSSSFRNLKKNSRAALKIVWRHRRSYPFFGAALALAAAYHLYAHLPKSVKAASFQSLSRLKKLVFAERSRRATQT